MRHSHLPVLSLAIASGLSAQATWTSPKPLANVEGNTDRRNWLAASSRATHSHEHALLDNTNTGTARTLRALSWRRDASLGPFPDGRARELWIAVRMIHANYAKVRYGGVRIYGPEFFRGSWVPVFADKKIKLPDWSARPATTPAPWTLKVTFDRPFAYDGKAAFITNWKFWNPDASTVLKRYPVDYQQGAGTSSMKFGTRRGVGCLVAGRRYLMEINAGAWTTSPVATGYPGSRLSVTGRFLPGSVPVVAFFGARADAKLPGVCTSVYTTMAVSLVLGVSSAGGGLSKGFPFVHRASFNGAQISAQVAGLDTTRPGLQVALSGGYDLAPYPAPPASGGEFGQSYIIYGNRGSRPQGGWPWGSSLAFSPGSAIPTRFE